ncbi:MAG: hypothetical protein AB1664_21365 [Thermodesulfobacteriota bacterium]
MGLEAENCQRWPSCLCYLFNDRNYMACEAAMITVIKQASETQWGAEVIQATNVIGS